MWVAGAGDAFADAEQCDVLVTPSARTWPSRPPRWRDLVTDHYLPPGRRALRERHVSPLTGPDLARARALAGPRAGRAVLAVCSDPSCLELGQIIQADLERIGIHIQLRPYAGAIGSATSRPGADIVLARIFSPTPTRSPSSRPPSAAGSTRTAWATSRLDRRQRLTAAGQLELQLMRGPAPVAAIGTPATPRILLRPSQLPHLPASPVRRRPRPPLPAEPLARHRQDG